jgi:mono/diheme cytochrome c family protein
MVKPLLVLSSFVLSALSLQQPAARPSVPAPASAVVPAEAAHMTNPFKPTPESQAKVKKIYGYDCALCHGANGNGKGDVVADLKLTLKDYTNPASLKDMSDGELFYVIKNGKGQMPGEGDRAKPEDLWNMVVLVRSFAAK